MLQLPVTTRGRVVTTLRHPTFEFAEKKRQHYFDSQHSQRTTTETMRSHQPPLGVALSLSILLQLPLETLSRQECGIYLAPSTIPGAGMYVNHSHFLILLFDACAH
jgi:hypothetical protein